MSKIEVNQISSQCGSTLTIGQSGDTVTLAAGATQSGFGQTYSAVSYCTTAKTTPFTAAAGTGYFVNTTSGAITVTLPASPTAGDVISFKDYAGTFTTNSLTLCNNGSKINGQCASTSLSISGQAITLIYVDATRGWKSTDNSTTEVTGSNYISATGGTVTICGNYKIHTFTSDGTFTVSTAPTPANNIVDYLVIAGGGGGGRNHGGGGGAGGYRESHCATTSGCYTASPLASATSLPVSIASYPIVIGGGGVGGKDITWPTDPVSVGSFSGSDSSFSTITSSGGGGGESESYSASPSANGGSGGGASYCASRNTAGTGNTPPVSPPQGNPGGSTPTSSPYHGGGGGGAAAAGSCGPSNGNGGAGSTTSISGTPTAYAGGGGGGGTSYGNPTGGTGGIGGGGNGTSSPCAAGCAGTTNTGGGGGAGYAVPGSPGGNGGSGIVIIRYKFQS